MGFSITTQSATPAARLKTHTRRSSRTLKNAYRVSRLKERGRRHYNPNIGRWTSRDPVGYTDGMALYRFAGNSPAFSYDAIGLEAMPGYVVNCLGYCLTEKQEALQPSLEESLWDFVTKAGWQCEQSKDGWKKTAETCSCECGKELAIVVYLYGTQYKHATITKELKDGVVNEVTEITILDAHSSASEARKKGIGVHSPRKDWSGDAASVSADFHCLLHNCGWKDPKNQWKAIPYAFEEKEWKKGKKTIATALEYRSSAVVGAETLVIDAMCCHKKKDESKKP